MSIKENLKIIKDNIADTCIKYNKNIDDITLLAATKTVDTTRINEAISLGITHIGENKVQELVDKFDKIDFFSNDKKIQNHFIGHLQTNKVKFLVDKVDLIQSLDSVKLALEIEKEFSKANKTIDCLVEVNIAEEENKSGVSLKNLKDLIKEVKNLPHINILGLMSVPPICDDNKTLYYFEQINEIFLDIRQNLLDNIEHSVLSIGMSNDYMLAIRAGSNMVRIGSAIFGARDYS